MPGRETTPTLVSILICDQVIDDKFTNKKSAIGLFNTIVASSLPSRVQQMAVLATLTEITSPTPLELRLLRDADNDVLFATQGRIDAPNPLATVDLVFTMAGIQFASTGQYAFELLSREVLLGRRRFHVVKPPPQQQQQPDPEQSGG
ncbi:MAG: hypothetical protein U1D55_12150 [Phycisphaerae bacterium]